MIDAHQASASSLAASRSFTYCLNRVWCEADPRECVGYSTLPEKSFAACNSRRALSFQGIFLCRMHSSRRKAHSSSHLSFSETNTPPAGGTAFPHFVLWSNL